MTHAHAHAPLLSIVTVVRNAEGLIGATFESVEKHKVPGVEYIVIDGDSSDGTGEVIEAFRHVIDVHVREPDRGIYDAMNKAAALARGRFILNINAGDALLRAPLAELSVLADEVSIAAFPVALTGNGIFVPRTGAWLSITNTLHHQGACYRKALLQPYDLAYRTFADFDLNQRMRAAAVAFPQAAPVASHSPGGQSQIRSHFHEVFAIIRKNSGFSAVLVAWLYFKLRGLRWRITSRFLSSS